MHCRSKEHVSKFNSKSEKVRSESAFYEHLLNTHGGKADNKDFSDYFEIQILKSYKKSFTRLVEERTFIATMVSCSTPKVSGTKRKLWGQQRKLCKAAPKSCRGNEEVDTKDDMEVDMEDDLEEDMDKEEDM